jgi:hypothetical protein
MKKLFLILCAIAFGMSGAKADVNLTTTMSEFHSFGKLPAKYTADSKDKVIIANYESRNTRKTYYSIYDASFTLVKEITADSTEFTDSYYYPCVMNLYAFDNFDGDNVSGNAINVTQTLFNNDAKYEYLMSVVEKVDGYSRGTGFKVKSENGTTVASVKFPEGYVLYSLSDNDAYLLELDGVNYIIIKVYRPNHEEEESYYYNLVYKIESSTSSVKQVGAPIKVKVFPTIVERGEMINVALPEIGANTGAINVVSTLGAVVFNQKVEAGTSQASIDTSSLQRGLYIVTIDNGKTRESTKIIIR